MKQKAEDMVVATKLDQPLKQMDTIAAKTIEEMEKTRKKVWKWPVMTAAKIMSKSHRAKKI